MAGGRFSCRWAGLARRRGISGSSRCPASGWAGRWGAQLGWLALAERGGIPYCMTSHSAIKAGGRGRKRGTFGVTAFVIRSNRYGWRSPAFLEMAEHEMPLTNQQYRIYTWFCVPGIMQTALQVQTSNSVIATELRMNPIQVAGHHSVLISAQFFRYQKSLLLKICNKHRVSQISCPLSFQIRWRKKYYSSNFLVVV